VDPGISSYISQKPKLAGVIGELPINAHIHSIYHHLETFVRVTDPC
ncbi:6869_t:CDS:1, partial [Acaulospora colombiana]